MIPNPLLDFIVAEHERLDEIVLKFGSYQPRDVTLQRLQIWLQQFRPEEFALALRVLEAVEFYDLARLHKLLRSLHTELRTVTAEAGFRKPENLVFCPIGNTGESGHEIVRRYRDVNGILRTNAKLAEVMDLPRIIYEAEKAGLKLAVVFLDDFIGTGKTVSDYWNEVLSQYIRPDQPMFLGTAVACIPGIDRIHQETPLLTSAVHHVQNAHLLFQSAHFTEAERYTIRTYCDQVGNPPLGVGGLGVMLAFAHGCPNNALAILRGSKKQKAWRGILPRFNDI
jgi:hypothetical protein